MPFPVTCSTPSSVALAEYLPTIYDLGTERLECFLASQGWADVYLVRTSALLSEPPKRYFLKVYATAWRTETDLHFQLDLIAHLARKGLGVALPLRGRDGSLLQGLDLPEGRRTFVLFGAAPGRPLAEQPGEVQSRLLGTLMARLHEAGKDFVSPHRRAPLDLEHLLDLSPLEAFGAGREEDLACLRRAADKIRQMLSSLPLSALEHGICHGDLGAQNVYLDGGPEGQATIIDFDDCGLGWYAYDLGHDFMYYSLFRAEQAERLWSLFLEGYRSQRNLEEIEVTAAPAFALVRFLAIHAHDNPLGAQRDRWSASWYVEGKPWTWMRQSVQTLVNSLPT